MRWWRAVVLSTVLADAAQAEESIVGRWVLDDAAFRAQVERHFAEQILQVPAEHQAAAEALADQAVAAAVAQMTGSAADFAADGTVVLEPGEGAPQEGTWIVDGKIVRLQPASAAPEAVPLIGVLEDDRLRLRAESSTGPGFVMRRVER